MADPTQQQLTMQFISQLLKQQQPQLSTGSAALVSMANSASMPLAGPSALLFPPQPTLQQPSQQGSLSQSIGQPAGLFQTQQTAAQRQDISTQANYLALLNLLQSAAPHPQPPSTPLPHPQLTPQHQQQLGGSVEYRRPSLLSNFNNEQLAYQPGALSSQGSTARTGVPRGLLSQGGDSLSLLTGRMQPPLSVPRSLPTPYDGARIMGICNVDQQHRPVASRPSAVNTELDELKQQLSENLEKNDIERLQCSASLKSARHKVEMLKRSIAENRASTEEEEGTETPRDGMGVEDGQHQQEDPLSSSDFKSSSRADQLIDRIYAENRRKAAASKARFPAAEERDPASSSTSISTSKGQRGGPDEETMRIVRDTYEKGLKFLPTLVKAMCIQRKKHGEERDLMISLYEETLGEWEKKVARWEKTPKKISIHQCPLRTRDMKSREIFEKTFPELKKQREEKERSNRIERARSIMEGAGGCQEGTSGGPASIIIPSNGTVDVEVENEIKMRSLAIIPPLATRLPRHLFDNRNGLEEDALTDWRNSIWSEWEKGVFELKIAKYGKNFAAIAAFLPTKGVKDCVHYYYHTKKRKNYKAKASRKRKKLGRQPYKAPSMPQLADLLLSVSSVEVEGFGVGQYRNLRLIDCLVCDEKMTLFLPAKGQPGIDMGFTDPFSSSSHTDSANADKTIPLLNQLPVCAKCIQNATKNKNANRCPLLTCGIGKRKPVRSVPEKFHSLSIEYKRFVVYRLRLPPNAVKCCNSCFKRIVKEVESLLGGELNAEWNMFNARLAEIESQHRSSASLLAIGMEEEAAVGDEDDEEELGGCGGISEATGEQTSFQAQSFLSIIQRQNSLICGGEVLSADGFLEEPSRKEMKISIKQEDGVLGSERVHEFTSALDTPRKESVHSGGSLTLGTPILRTISQSAEFKPTTSGDLAYDFDAHLKWGDNAENLLSMPKAVELPHMAMDQALNTTGIPSLMMAAHEIVPDKADQEDPSPDSAAAYEAVLGQNIKHEPVELLSTAINFNVVVPIERGPSPHSTSSCQLSGEISRPESRGKRTNFAQQVAQAPNSDGRTISVKQFLSEHLNKGQRDATASPQQQQQKRKSGLANALLSTPATPPRNSLTKHTGQKHLATGKVTFIPTTTASTTLPSVTSTSEESASIAWPEKLTTTSLSYENLSDSGEEDVEEAGEGGSGQPTPHLERRFDSATPPMLYSFLNLPPAPSSGRTSTSTPVTQPPIHSPLATSREPTSAGLSKSFGGEAPTTIIASITSKDVTNPLREGVAPPPTTVASCVYEPLSDDEAEAS